VPLARISRDLAREVQPLAFAPPVTVVLNPLAYARVPHERYLALAGDGPFPVVLLGMNPGPFGMARTGVPFGDVPSVRDWLGISGPVRRPASEHPRRPILGFACPRSEVSGARLWGWARERFRTPAAFFRRFLVWNHVPLAFLEASGRNRTPDRLPAEERAPLLAACDEALRRLVDLVEAELVVGIGTFAEARARAALAGRGVRVGRVPHPSPASPAANRGWAQAMDAGLHALGVPLGRTGAPA
jgi:single-strand selective monofunctional uracil DNA glycosylase